MLSDNDVKEWQKKHHPNKRPSKLMRSYFDTECECCGNTIFEDDEFSFIGDKGDSDKICEDCRNALTYEESEN